MKVQMLVSITGTRNGVEWPARGGVINLPDAEAVDMLNAGLVAPSPEPEPERAVVRTPVEKAVRGRRKG